MIAIPADFVSAIESREGEAGRAWLADLPGVVADLCQQWSLEVDGHPWHGHLAIVVPVRHEDALYALKISWQDADTMHEAHALAIWTGRDTVQLFESSPEHGAMLLERLDANHTLFDLPLDRAIPIAGQIVRNLAVPGDSAIPTVSSLAAEIVRTLPERWEQFGRPVIPKRRIDQAGELAAALAAFTSSTMVNWDLHHGNVLFSPLRQKWIAIDPKPAIGAPESGIAPLFWTRVADFTGPAEFHCQLDALIDVAELNPVETRDWMLVRAVDFWLWELGVGLVDDPGGCAVILDWLNHR